MRRSIIHTLFILLTISSLWSVTTVSHAQEITSSADTAVSSSIIDFLQTPKLGQGSIRIFQSPAIRTLVKVRPNNLNSASITGGFSVMNGYKVQLYSGNASNSKAIAQQRATMVEELFPEFELEMQYKAPFWRVRVGNFITQSEAHDFLHILKKEFPRYGKEMYVVPATIKIAR